MQSLAFTAGAIVTIRREQWRVASTTEAGGAVRVDVTRIGTRLPSAATFFAPFDQIDARPSPRRPRRVRRQRWQAALLGTRAFAEHLDLPLAALPAGIDVIPYQLEPLLAMRDGARRVLIADAVGLGKTIQAGLLIAELLRRGEAARVLVIAPSHLCPQWRDELSARFRLAPQLADAHAIADLSAQLPRQINPWSTGALWIASLDYLKQSHILHTLPPHPWDLVVVDEAHMLAGQSERRIAAQAITSSTRRAVFLTATPVSGADSGRVLLGMGALSSHDAMTVFRRSRADVGIHTRSRQRRVRISPSTAERHALDLIDAFSRAAIHSATPSTTDATHLLVSVLAKRALSTCAALAISTERRLAHLAGLPRDVADATQASLDFGDDDEAALTGTIGMAGDRERSWMRRLRDAARTAARDSRKIARLVTLLTRAREPAIVFTEFRDSLAVVADALTRRGVDVAVAHGGLAPSDLQRALDDFRHARARVLVATDVASHGLNLHQSARWVVHLDLPWNPIRLEQRAGRVDRIGQTREVHVTQLVLTHARDLAFARRLSARAEAAAHHTALITHTRWRRRARAAAALLEQRRRWARAWRGLRLSGRPLAMARGGADVCEHDLDGAETLVLCADSDGASARRLHARVRRVARAVSVRAQRALVVERALQQRCTATVAQSSLPGARAVTELRLEVQRAAAIADARAASAARIAALAARAGTVTVTVTARRRFAASRN